MVMKKMSRENTHVVILTGTSDHDRRRWLWSGLRTYGWCIFVFFLVCSLAACKSKKSVDQMSDEEKIAYQLDDSLTESEKRQQIEVRREIIDRMNQTKSSDKALEEVMNQARDVLEETQYKALESAQQLWLRQGRGKDIQALVQKGVPAAQAFSQAANERAEWLSVRVSWAMLMNMPGEFGGFYHASDGRTLELYEMPGNHLNLVIRVPDNDLVITATGTYDDKMAQLHEEDSQTVILKISRQNAGEIMLVATDVFGKSVMAQARPLAEGAFYRYQAGEIDVFAP